MKLRDLFEKSEKESSAVKSPAFLFKKTGKQSAKKDTASVKKSLIDRDGHDPAIVVKKRR